jgi:hypothetical protein
MDFASMTSIIRLRISGRLLLIVAAGACSSPSEVLVPEAAPSSVVGCYSVQLGRWSGTVGSAEPPPAIALLDSVGTYLLEAGNTMVRPDPLTAPMAFGMAWWTRPESEHLDVTFSHGEGGVRLHLVWGWGDGSWRGTAASITDVHPAIRAIATARLLPRVCS